VQLPRDEGQAHQCLLLHRVVRAAEVTQEGLPQLADHPDLVGPRRRGASVGVRESCGPGCVRLGVDGHHAVHVRQRQAEGADLDEQGAELLGCFHAVAGFVGIFQEDYYRVGENGLVITVDYTTWGWIHLLLGIVVVLAGAALLRGAMWARIVAIVLAVVSSMANLAFMPAYPLWSLIMITVNVLVIYAVTAHGDPRSLGAY